MLNMNIIITLADYRGEQTKNNGIEKALERDIKTILNSMTLSIDALIEADKDEYAEHHKAFKKSLWIECNDLMQQIDLMLECIPD